MTQREALAILKTGANVFLTGEPGAGKTFVVNEYVRWLRASGIEPAITAATGIAATHISGMTLHSWSGIGVADALSVADIDRIAQKEPVARRVGKAKVLIIDEVSMLSAAVLDAADAVCREVRRADAPFGGLSLVLVGDFFQLPPVSRGRDPSVRFCYESAAWQALNPIACYLSEQHRQEDAAFLDILSAMRASAVEELHYERLSARRASAPPADAPRLYSHNADVDRENAAELAKLPGAAKVYRMTASGRENLVEALKRGCLSPETLELKEGAEVMFTKNSPQGRYANGTLGRVAGFDSESGYPIVETRQGSAIVADPMEWQVVEDGKVRASIAQIPLRLAYAMTVHKSQGMSMDAAAIDLARAFEYGQGYVALSRVRTLDGLHLLGLNARALEVHPEVALKDHEFRAASEAAAETFAAMVPAELEEMQKNFVRAMGGDWLSEEAFEEKKSRGGLAAAGKRASADRYADTLALLREKKPLNEIAKARELTVQTIIRHIETLAAQGRIHRADYEYLLPRADAIAEIREALAAAEGDKLAPVHEALRGRYSYEAIRLARLTGAK
ncbi:MAG: AAA family ATPase [Patescibacteria group bacterium]|nr:AAA family ATPase [Patescibacteria group bacterium]MDE1944219.1 AAA family ATPase [Patescibacteria group bacterium]MDE2057564.1 AAA family ATPase [Patescibacteria group bacterium]